MKFKHLDSVDPSTCLSGKMNRICRLTANIFRRHLSTFDVTSSQLTLLFVLLKRGGITQKDMSALLFMEKSSLNRNLKKLFQKNYASRETFPEITITHKGKRLLDEVIPHWEAAMREIREILNDDGEQAVNTILTKLRTTQ